MEKIYNLRVNDYITIDSIKYKINFFIPNTQILNIIIKKYIFLKFLI